MNTSMLNEDLSNADVVLVAGAHIAPDPERSTVGAPIGVDPLRSTAEAA